MLGGRVALAKRGSATLARGLSPGFGEGQGGGDDRALGRCEVLRRVAAGGMAEVLLARQSGPHGFQRVVAVKRVLPEHAADAEFVASFLDEARSSARLQHPNVVQSTGRSAR